MADIEEINENFNKRLRELANSFLGMGSTRHNEIVFRSAVMHEVALLYAHGGSLADLQGRPITFEDVELIVSRGKHSKSVSAIRKKR